MPRKTNSFHSSVEGGGEGSVGCLDDSWLRLLLAMRFADEDSGREIDNDDTALKCNFVEGWPEIDAQCDGPPRLKHINDSRQRETR